MVDAARLAVVVEAHGHVAHGLGLGLHHVEAVEVVVRVVVRVGWQFDDEHLGVAGALLVVSLAGLARQAFPVMVHTR